MSHEPAPDGRRLPQSRPRPWGLVGVLLRKPGVVTVADQGVVSATTFLTVTIVMRSVTEQQRGVFYLGMSLVAFVIMVQTALISSPYVYHYPRMDEDKRRLYSASTLYHLGILGLVASLALLLASSIPLLGLGPAGVVEYLRPLSAVLAMVAIAAPMAMLREYARQISFARLEPWAAVAVDVPLAALQIGGIALLWRAGALTPARPFPVIAFACAVVGLGWLWRHRRTFALQTARVAADLRRNFGFGSWLLLDGIALWLSLELYAWFMKGVHGETATGKLGACITLTKICDMLIRGVGNFVGPKASHAHAGGGIEAVDRIVQRGTLVLGGMLAAFCAVAYFAGDWLVDTIFHVPGTGPTTFLLTLGFFASGVAITAMYGLWALKRPQVNFWSRLVALSITLTAGLKLATDYGIVGAAAGTVFGNAAAAAFCWTVYKREVRKRRAAEAGA